MRRLVIRIILSTDMARHHDSVEDFTASLRLWGPDLRAWAPDKRVVALQARPPPPPPAPAPAASSKRVEALQERPCRRRRPGGPACPPPHAACARLRVPLPVQPPRMLGW